MYHALIVLSVVIFGGCFALQDAFRKKQGSGIRNSLRYSFWGSLAGTLLLLLINGAKLEVTAFTLLMALIAALNGFAFTFCSFKALDRINLSLYSLFSMLGGMVRPFLQGIFFYGEKMTLAKALCFPLIVLALLLTVEKGKKTKGAFYYGCIFVLNGMSGVLSKIFVESDLPKTDATGYTILISLCSAVISGVLLLTVFRKSPEDQKSSLSGTVVGAVSGALNRAANLILVIALAHVDASVQYPMVTGGVMIVSTLICFFGEDKPSKKELLSILVAFIGLVLLFVIPI